MYFLQGRVTHHGIKTSSDGELVLNRNRFGGHSTLESLVKQLGSVQPNWPIALDKPCAPSLETTREQKPEVPEPEVAPQVAPPIDSREGPSHHKEKKQMVLMSVRNKTGRIDTYEFVQRDEEFIVDGHTLPSCKSVNGALEYLAEKHEWWPTALAYAVGWPAHKTDASLTSMINTTIVLIENHFAGFGQVANPVISVSDDAASLHIECDTPGCHIYYTTDGSVPSADGSGSSTRFVVRIFDQCGFRTTCVLTISLVHNAQIRSWIAFKCWRLVFGCEAHYGPFSGTRNCFDI